jgi:hypothetical protein
MQHDRHLGVGEEKGEEEVGRVLEGYGSSSGKYPGVFCVVVLLIAVTILDLIHLAVTIILRVTIFQSQLVTSYMGSIHPYSATSQSLSGIDCRIA